MILLLLTLIEPMLHGPCQTNSLAVAVTQPVRRAPPCPEEAAIATNNAHATWPRQGYATAQA